MRWYSIDIENIFRNLEESDSVGFDVGIAGFAVDIADTAAHSTDGDFEKSEADIDKLCNHTAYSGISSVPGTNNPLAIADETKPSLHSEDNPNPYFLSAL